MPLNEPVVNEVHVTPLLVVFKILPVVPEMPPEIKPVESFKNQTSRKAAVIGEEMADQLNPPSIVFIIVLLLPTA